MNRPRPPQNPADDEPAVLHRRIAELEAALEAQAAELSQAQQLASRAYQEHTERIARLAASVPGMLYQVVLAPDQSFTFTYVSDGCRELYELEPTDLLQNPQLLIDAITPEAREQMQDSLQSSMEQLTPWAWEGQIQTPSGAYKWVQGSARPARRADGTTLWDGLMLDVTAAKERELAERQRQEEVIQAQRIALSELATPLIPISDDVLVMPLVGSMDTRRAQEIFQALLHGLERSRARTAIIDITGLSVVDTQVANTLLRSAQAARLLGVRVMLTGIRPEVAQTIVNLGVDLGDLRTSATLQSGISDALQNHTRN